MRLTNVDHNFKEWYTRRGMIHLRQWEACHATGGTSNHKHGVLAKGHSFWIVDLQFGCQNGNVHHSFLATSFYMIPPCCLVYIIYSVVHLFWKNICYTHVFHHIFSSFHTFYANKYGWHMVLVWSPRSPDLCCEACGEIAKVKVHQAGRKGAGTKLRS